MTLASDVALAAPAANDDALDAAAVPSRTRAEARSAVAPGDSRAALASLYAAHGEAIHRFLCDLLGDAALAADATQETFARAFRGLGTLRDADKRAGWLFGIARNVSLEARKARRTARSRFAEEGDPDAAPCGGRSPEALLLGREAARIVAQAMSALPEERRAALLMRLDHGLPYEEIAAALGWSVAKAKVEVFRAREVLREVMRRYEGDAP